VQISHLFSRRTGIAIAVFAVAAFAGGLFAFEPVTRNLVANDALCTYCHIEQEYVPTLLTSVAEPHPRSAEGGRARCVDCHLPEGFRSAIFAYTHFASLTDLFGRFRDLESERAGDWIPPRAATVHRVRDRLFENDSVTCRSCHEESEIKPKSSRGQMAHRQAQRQGQTCIQCHYNMAHRQVELSADAFQGQRLGVPDPAAFATELGFDVTIFPDDLAERLRSP
jgi:cytochrome c-type protein NapC